jgi:hypothetical protein
MEMRKITTKSVSTFKIMQLIVTKNINKNLKLLIYCIWIKNVKAHLEKINTKNLIVGQLL